MAVKKKKAGFLSGLLDKLDKKAEKKAKEKKCSCCCGSEDCNS